MSGAETGLKTVLQYLNRYDSFVEGLMKIDELEQKIEELETKLAESVPGTI